MEFRWWYVSMAAAAVLVFGSMVYLGTFLCLPIEEGSCVSVSNAPSQIPAVHTDTVNPVTQPITPSTPGNSSNSIPIGTGGSVPPNGNKIEFTLSFVMSSDLTKYAFNALPGQAGTNPEIKVKSGDTVTIHVKNDSKSFHAFGIVVDPENPESVLWNSAVKTPDDPLKPKESGDVTFVAGTAGLYHYICTVPGHAELGMDGNFIVEP